MKTSVAALAVTSIVAATPAPAAAADSFARHVWPNINFLDRSSRLAMTRSKSRKLRSFARSEAAEQTVFANAFVAWMEARVAGQNEPPERAERAAPNGSLIAAPFRIASRVTSGVADTIDGVQTGRSVAVEDEASGRKVTLPEIQLPHSGENLKRLSALSGAAFDRLFVTMQKDALLQLSTSYASYIQDGGDAALKSLAVRALPVVNKRLASLQALD